VKERTSEYKRRQKINETSDVSMTQKGLDVTEGQDESKENDEKVFEE
jgi:hypothetical protein